MTVSIAGAKTSEKGLECAKEGQPKLICGGDGYLIWTVPFRGCHPKHILAISNAIK